MRNTIQTVLISVVVTLLCLSPIAYKFNQRIPHPIATVDVKKIIEKHEAAFISELQSGPSPQNDEFRRKQINQSTIEFAQGLDRAISAQSKLCGCILINKAALLNPNDNGIVDFTDQVQQQLSAASK